MRQALARDGGQQVQVVADDRVGPEGGIRLGQRRRERRVEARRHVRRQVAVARGAVRHLVGHADHRKGQLVRLEAHGAHEHARRQDRLVARSDAAHDGGLVPGGHLAAHRFGQVHAAAGAVGFLRGDVEDSHSAIVASFRHPVYRGLV